MTSSELPTATCRGSAAVRAMRVGSRSLLLALAALVVGCGPSVQAVYEGSIRFEHCYRLDLDARIAPSHRLACWREWLRSYTYGQRKDRVDYARARVDAIQRGDREPDALDLEGDEPREREFYLSVPAPTSAYAPPPPVSPAPESQPAHDRSASEGSASEGRASEGPPPPGQSCVLACQASWQACAKRCQASETSDEAAGASKTEGGAGTSEGKSSGTQRKGAQSKGAQSKGAQSKGAQSKTVSDACEVCKTEYQACATACLTE